MVVLGSAGIAAAVVLTFLLDNPLFAPLFAVASAPEMLPEPSGAIGRMLPPGAGATLLLTSTDYLQEAGGSSALWMLAI